MNTIDSDSVERLKNALLEFVERTTKKATSDTEVQALPEVAAILVEILKLH